jgi:hypothetical protein
MDVITTVSLEAITVIEALWQANLSSQKRKLSKGLIDCLKIQMLDPYPVWRG